nr:ABC transporter ATP-binding protein [Actinomadura rayongensis]
MRDYLWLRGRFAGERAPGTAPPVPSRIVHGLDLDGVGFAYDDGPPALDGVTLHVPAGSLVVLIGENGAGKSTLVKLLTGVYAPTRGRILLDGADIAGFARDDWHAAIAVTFQDFVRYELTAGQNIGVGDLPRLDDAPAAWDALRSCGDGAWARGLPDGLDTPVGRTLPGAVDLSGGQWQQLAIARGRLRDRPLLHLVDEPGAGLDPAAEEAVVGHYVRDARRRAAATGTITVLVTHRMTTAVRADLVVFLDAAGGALAGAHADLLAASPRYAELFTAQAAAYHVGEGTR